MGHKDQHRKNKKKNPSHIITAVKHIEITSPRTAQRPTRKKDQQRRVMIIHTATYRFHARVHTTNLIVFYSECLSCKFIDSLIIISNGGYLKFRSYLSMIGRNDQNLSKAHTNNNNNKNTSNNL